MYNWSIVLCNYICVKSPWHYRYYSLATEGDNDDRVLSGRNALDMFQKQVQKLTDLKGLTILTLLIRKEDIVEGLTLSNNTALT